MMTSRRAAGATVYVAPFVCYLTLTMIAARVPAAYVWLYCLAVAATAVVSVVLLRGRGIVKPHWRIIEAVVVGLAGIALWIAISELHLEQHAAAYLPSWLGPGERAALNPWDRFSHPLALTVFLGVRLVGLVILIPIAEELFWRGFLLRWFISADWQHVALGAFSIGSFLMVTVMFALAHPEWLAAAAYCALLNGFLYWKKDLWCCIVAHGVSNLLLAAYVLATKSWWLW